MYYRIGRSDAFAMILKEALQDRGVDQRIIYKHLFQNEKQRLKAMNALACYYRILGENEIDADKRNELNELGYQTINFANMESQMSADNLVSMCFYNIAKGAFSEANGNLNNCELMLKEEPDSGLKSLCSLMRAIINFNSGKYQECLQELR
jgi:hypothetical protein